MANWSPMITRVPFARRDAPRAGQRGTFHAVSIASEVRAQRKAPLTLYAVRPHFHHANALAGEAGEGAGGVIEMF